MEHTVVPSEMPPTNESAADPGTVTVHVHRLANFPQIRADWEAFVAGFGYAGFSHRLAWGEILQQSLGHEPYFLTAQRGGQITGVLPLVFVRSMLFGRFLVGLSYLNTGGVLSECPESARRLLDRAVSLADELHVRHLELRSEREWVHPQLTETMTAKVHMRMQLPATADELMAGFKSKLRSQVKKSLGNEQTVVWGREDLLTEFYSVFCRNMRDLGTPVFPQGLFREMLSRFGGAAELCVLRQSNRPVAGAILLHGPGTTQVPSASTLREFNASNANMRMYWHLLERAIQRQQAVFDFGRSSVDSGTYRFKEQWGACQSPAVWQYYRRTGQADDMRPNNPKYSRMIVLWKHLPVSVANTIGPWLVRGIP